MIQNCNHGDPNQYEYEYCNDVLLHTDAPQVEYKDTRLPLVPRALGFVYARRTRVDAGAHKGRTGTEESRLPDRD